MSLDLEAIKARAEAFKPRAGAESSLAAMRSAADVPELVAEVERLQVLVDFCESGHMDPMPT